MATRWEHEELQSSRDRGAWDRWGVQDAELRGDWLFFAFDQRRIYAPLEHKELPHHFARIATNPDALLPFVQQYGRLGWHHLITDESGNWRRRPDPWLRTKSRAHQRFMRQHGEGAVYAEPVDWIQAHAQTIHWCLAAGHAVRIADARSSTARCAELSQALPTPMGFKGTVRSGLLRQQGIDKMPPRHFVGGMIEDYLWINMFGIRRRVLYENGRFRSVWGGDSLLESIYTLVADAVTGGRLGQCRACGAVFLQTDERQQFCPPREGFEKSACMNRLRVARYRRRIKREQRQEQRHGKTTRPR
ncbi:MAG TPA: hypothetical protein VNJ04_21370 [Gemmatimonadaceae bacterium]|nr:hypothetical protein [Gemmatimonadaceae bacterium]